MSDAIRIAFSSGAVALALGSVAVADVSGLIGNTVVAYDRQHRETTIKVRLHADGTYQTSVSGRLGKPITTRGTWSERDGRLCYTQTSDPVPGHPVYFCAHDMNGKKVGDSWLERWDDGVMYKAEVVAGTG